MPTGIPTEGGEVIDPRDGGGSSSDDDDDGGGGGDADVPSDEEIRETIAERTGGHGLGAGPGSQASGRGGSGASPGSGFGAGVEEDDGSDGGASTPGDQGDDRDRTTPGSGEAAGAGTGTGIPGAPTRRDLTRREKAAAARGRGDLSSAEATAAGAAGARQFRDRQERRIDELAVDQATEDGQGIEERADVSPELRESALELENRLVESGQVESADQVAIFYDEEADRLVPRLTDEGEEAADRSRRSEAVADLEAQLEDQLGFDVTPGEDFIAVEEGDGMFRAAPTSQLLERIEGQETEAGRRASATVNELLGATPEEFDRRQAAEDLDDQLEREIGVELDRGEDYTIETSTNDEGDQVYRAELTDAGQRKAAGDEFEREVRDVPLPNPLAAGDPSQAPVFTVPLSTIPAVDEEDATLEDVLGGTSGEIRRGADELAETTDVINPFVLAGRTVRLAEERGPFGFSGYDVLTADDEADEGTIERQGEALAAGVYETPAYVVDTALAGEELREFSLEAADRTVETTRVEERPEPVVGQGPRRGTDHRLRSETPGFAVEETVETGEQAVEGFSRALETPTSRARLTGSLVGTALVMGGAGAISGRTGAATRFAIQPGEELLTVGASRAAPGLARKFPNNRIDNEEIVLRGIARGGRRVAERARWIRSRVRGESTYSDYQPGAVMRPRDRGQLSLVDLLPGGRAETRAETEPELDEPTPTIGGEDIPPSIDAWRRELGPSHADVSSRFDVETNPMRERARRSTRRSVETETEVEEELDRARRAAELSVVGAATGASAATTAGAMERLDLAQEARVGLGTETELEGETEAEAEAEAEAELALEAAIEAELELELEAEAETEAETGLEIEAEADQERDRELTEGLDPAPFGEPGDPAEDLLFPGWVSETITDIALGARTRERAAPQELLEAAPIEQRALGELPTYEELLGTAEEQEAIEEARALLSPSAGDVEEGAARSSEEFGVGLELDPAAFDFLDEGADVDDQGGGLL